MENNVVTAGTWSLFDEQTGEFTGIVFEGPEDQLAANTPPGCRAEPGRATRPRPDFAIAADVRVKRDAMLAATDIMVLRAVENGTPVPQVMKAYRQALRDVPAQPGFPHAIVWPEAPS